MKTTVVPAQVTTVEDKVAGNLSFTQLLLLTTPIFLSGAFFVVFPPMFRYTVFKFAVVVALTIFCVILAIRIKGKILLQWIMIVSRYRVRPRFYLFNKNDTYLRHRPAETLTDPETLIQTEQVDNKPLHRFIPTPEMVRIESAILDPRAKFHLKAEKGALRVYIHEVKEEGI